MIRAMCQMFSGWVARPDQREGRGFLAGQSSNCGERDIRIARDPRPSRWSGRATPCNLVRLVVLLIAPVAPSVARGQETTPDLREVAHLMRPYLVEAIPPVLY